MKRFIGKGAVTALMQKSIEMAKEMNEALIWLGVCEKNKLAIDFYSKWEFKKFDTHVFLLGNDPQQDWLMKKEIG